MTQPSTFTSDVRLGERYRDTVSGFEGTATACYFFLHGCERVLLEQYDQANAELKELSFDAPRLEHVPPVRKAPRIPTRPLTARGTGGWKADPAKKGPR